MKPLRVLVVEDLEDDYLLVRDELVAAGFTVVSERVDTAETLERVLAARDWDLILSDYSMPQFTALDALRILHASRQPDLPLVIVSGSIGESSAVAALKAGASNYVMKGSLAQLVPVVDRELKDARTRRERNEAFVALERAVRARDEFLSIASHELKTPLTSLRLQTESLLRAARRGGDVDRTNERVTTRLEAIERNAQRLTHLIERLLEFTRVTSGAIELAREHVDLVALVGAVVAQLADTFHDARSDVTVTSPERLEGSWDRERLENMLNDLLSNAAKFGPDGPIAV
ncbi:MAG: hybrid sensor histidine kinase/response regulator, partial [Myxococcota bacterium]|nr:hybrid sensor histidine kinase/response regulator [Myxococcota bacterium]